MKKILSLAICLLIIFSCGTTAFATETIENLSTATPDSGWDLVHNWRESKTYEFVSYTPPTRDTYIFEDSAYPGSLIYPNLLNYFIDLDDTGMTVTVKNKLTGELEVYGDESVEDRLLSIPHLYVTFKKSGKINQFTTLFLDNGEVMGFDYSVNVIFRNTDWETQPSPSENDFTIESTTQRPAPQISTADSATSDEVIVAPTTVSNKPVGTGDFFPSCLVFVTISALTMVAIVAYRKKKEL